MMLVCPEAYPAVHPAFAAKFDAVISYENIAAALRTRAWQASDETARRLVFRVSTYLIRRFSNSGADIPTHATATATGTWPEAVIKPLLFR